MIKQKTPIELLIKMIKKYESYPKRSIVFWTEKDYNILKLVEKELRKKNV